MWAIEVPMFDIVWLAIFGGGTTVDGCEILHQLVSIG